MIRSFRSAPLKQFWTPGDASKIQPAWRDKVKARLSNLDVAVTPEEMDIPGYSFHWLSGPRKGTFSICVTRNWRITFEWDDQDAINVGLEDDH